MKIANPGAIKLGDVRLIKRGKRVYMQEYVPGGWEFFQLKNDQTLTYCIAKVIRAGFKYMGTEPDDTVYYYSNRLPTTAEAFSVEDLMPGSTREEQSREALASIERLYRSGSLSDMDVFHLLNGNPTTGEE